MTDLIARALYVLVALLARLPWRLLSPLARLIAALWLRTGARESRVARRNIELAFPELDCEQQARLHRRVLETTALQAVETLRLWTRPHAENLALIRERHGTHHLDAALLAKRGVIVAAPHYGNWELLNQWLADRTPLSILYKAPDSAVGEAFLQKVRSDPGKPGDRGERVTQIRAEGPAVRQLFKLLGAGGVAGILPDQQPKAGDGEFAPFFGVQALTMTLLGRLAGRTGAQVLLAWCERIDAPHDGPPRFALHLEPAPEDIGHADPAVAVAALNAAVEAIARRDPSQYQWTYKRYTLRPKGSGEVTPYLR
ncbi:MAG: lauroyl acyltransferase [Pseudomonadota bacterium]|nr:lauroyl acyltransferase [Pseudomonadota bacterium]